MREDSTNIVLLAARLGLAALLTISGALKVGHADALASSLAGYQLLPASALAPIALALPFLEIGVGLYLLVGLFTRMAAIVATVQFALYAAAISSALLRGLPVSCGCFGPNDRAKGDWLHVALDIALVFVSVALAARPPIALSIDSILKD